MGASLSTSSSLNNIPTLDGNGGGESSSSSPTTTSLNNGGGNTLANSLNSHSQKTKSIKISSSKKLSTMNKGISLDSTFPPNSTTMLSTSDIERPEKNELERRFQKGNFRFILLKN